MHVFVLLLHQARNLVPGTRQRSTFSAYFSTIQLSKSLDKLSACPQKSPFNPRRVAGPGPAAADSSRVTFLEVRSLGAGHALNDFILNFGHFGSHFITTTTNIFD